MKIKTPTVFLALMPAMALAFTSPPPLISVRRSGLEQRTISYLPAKNFIDEILDGLDTMAGISPLSEADLKTENVDLVRRAEERGEVAPPSDALQKPSVSVFFFLLGFVPVVLSALAIKSGFRPLGL